MHKKKGLSKEISGRFVLITVIVLIGFLVIGCSSSEEEKAPEEAEQGAETPAEPVFDIEAAAKGAGLPIRELCKDVGYFEVCMNYGFKSQFRDIRCEAFQSDEEERISYNNICNIIYAYSKEKAYLCEEMENEEYKKICYALQANKCPMEENEVFSYILLITEQENYLDSCEKIDFKTLILKETAAVEE